MPETEREDGMKTFDDFCMRFEIDKSVISEFQDVESFTDDYYNASIAWGKSKIPEMLHALHAKYKSSKDPKDLKMYHDILTADAKRKDESKSASRAGLLRELFNAAPTP